MKCPGQDSRYWQSDAIFETKCPECGSDIEFFKDDPSRRCKNCGYRLLNPNVDFGCASYCKFAEQCIGNMPPELIAQNKELLKDKVPLEIKEEKPMKIKRNIIEIDEELCDGCGQCVPSCAEGALQIIDGKARLVSEVYCDGLGACLGDCPTGALKIVEREAEDFDEEAVEEHLSSNPVKEPGLNTVPAGCPGSQIQTFNQADPCREANIPSAQKSGSSELSHWPVKLKLVPPSAPFLKGAKLLVAADCVPVAAGNFHGDFLKDRVVMIGCPKFDDIQEYIEKFAEIFKVADIKDVAVVVMEVPCCQGLPGIVQRGMELAGKQVPMKKMVVGRQGNIIQASKT